MALLFIASIIYIFSLSELGRYAPSGRLYGAFFVVLLSLATPFILRSYSFNTSVLQLGKYAQSFAIANALPFTLLLLIFGNVLTLFVPTTKKLLTVVYSVLRGSILLVSLTLSAFAVQVYIFAYINRISYGALTIAQGVLAAVIAIGAIWANNTLAANVLPQFRLYQIYFGVIMILVYPFGINVGNRAETFLTFDPKELAILMMVAIPIAILGYLIQLFQKKIKTTIKQN